MGLGSFAALTALVLNPFNSAPDFIQAGKPWFAFDDQGPVLQLVRVQKAPTKNCKAWLDALTSVPGDELVPVRSGDNAESLKRDWEPWTEKDLEPIKECDEFPCKVKLDAAEVASMEKTPAKERVLKFNLLVLERMNRYLKTQARKGYEFPGDPIDPWKLFEARGFKSSVERPSTPTLFVRKLNFAPDKMLTIHQVLDRRVARSATPPPPKKPSKGSSRHGSTSGSTSGGSSAGSEEAIVWTRDVYTDHYFDSWGEWSSVHCDASQGEVVVIQSLLSEMDLLKSKSIFAHAAFGRFRSAYEDNGKVYLDGQFDRLKKLAEKNEANGRGASAEKLAPALPPGH